ncbi:LADA_0C12156g1_1 [Lachancea dasiensis]|uniref:LADA_0C12156g1_1 n=1 Tax=Lachancea dasiensis TaxID=1072105 RepID=A0A1G4J1W8_9SACH|nr:LADA_0C12156g1_1 [Lachancea dasiensis]
MATPSEAVGSVCNFTEKLRKEHELYLLKYCLLIHQDPTQALGPLDQRPQKVPQIPRFVVTERMTDTGDSYVCSGGDPQGEAKIDRRGTLLGSRHFLFPTFTPPTRPYGVYVLVRDLLKCLGRQESAEQFLEMHQELYGLNATSEELAFLRTHGLVQDADCSENEMYVTTKSVFMLFGARVVVGGTRLVDDYWEEAIKEQGFLPHFRVFEINSKILQSVTTLKPTASDDTSLVADADAATRIPDELPHLTVAEETSSEVIQDYANQFSNGEHLNIIIPGQNITGSLELSAQCKLPKYHSKMSLHAATQLGFQDTPIGSIPVAAPVATTSHEKGDKRLLSGILDPLVISKVDRSGVTQWGNSGIVAQDVSLNINGWKFDSLPVKSVGSANSNYSIKGLPLYDNVKLAERLKKLTPTEINEMQYLHDSVYVNTKLQSARKVRKTKWTKYWQYKAGLPIGITERDGGLALKKYFQEVASHIDVVSTINTALDREEVKTIKRRPTANFLGYSNVTGLKPPYVND